MTRTPEVLTLMKLVTVFSVFGVPYLVLMPVVARDLLHVGADGYGVAYPVAAEVYSGVRGALGGIIGWASTARAWMSPSFIGAPQTWQNCAFDAIFGVPQHRRARSLCQPGRRVARAIIDDGNLRTVRENSPHQIADRGRLVVCRDDNN